MTVKELIEKLSVLDPDHLVVTMSGDYTSGPLKLVQAGSYYKDSKDFRSPQEGEGSGTSVACVYVGF
jgi:hypothetical protein